MSNAAQLALGSYLSRRNRIINGAMMINQRANSGNAAIASTYVYTGADRWPLVTGGGAAAALTQTTATYADGNGIFKKWLVQTVTTATTDFSGTKYWGGIFQAIEGWRAYDLVSNPNGIAVGFWFRAKVPGTYAVTLNDGAFAYYALATFAYTAGADTPQYVSVTFPTMNSNVSVGMSVLQSASLVLRIGALATGTSSGSTLNAWVQASNVYAYNGSANWGAAVSNYIAVTDVQLEEGPNSTPFDRLAIDEETLACERYWCSSYPSGIAPGTTNQDGTALWAYTGVTAGSVYQGPNIYYPVPMRTVPTVTAYNPRTGATGSAWAQNQNTSLAGGPVSSGNNKNTTFGLTNQAVQAADFTKWHFVASAELF